MNPLWGLFLGFAGTLLTAGTGFYLSLRRLRADVRKTDAEATATEQSAAVNEASAAVQLIDAARELIAPYQEQVAVLRAELDAARKDVANFHRLNRELTAKVYQLEQHMTRLETELQAVGVTPPEKPKG